MLFATPGLCLYYTCTRRVQKGHQFWDSKSNKFFKTDINKKKELEFRVLPVLAGVALACSHLLITAFKYLHINVQVQIITVTLKIC